MPTYLLHQAANVTAAARCFMVIPFVRRLDFSNSTPRADRRVSHRAAADPVPLVGNTDPWSWLLAASLKIDLWRLARFNELMSRHRLPVHLGRMFRDPAYAFECLSQAHGTGVRELKALALEMLDQYQQLEQRRRSDSVAAPTLSRH